jgi:hypothetical protein
LVAGTTRVAGTLQIATGAGYSNYATFTHDDVNLTIGINRVSNAGNIILSPYGNVGIGNTSPSEKLNVTGKIKASDVLLGNNGTKGYGAITTTTSTSTPTGGSSGDFTFIY